MNPAERRITAAALKLFADKGSTDVSVSELAEAAGVARGTIYNNLEAPGRLFETVAAALADEMNERIEKSYAGIADPAVRLAVGMRLYVRRAHEEPVWGRFLIHFGVASDSLRSVWSGAPLKDLTAAIDAKRFDLTPAQIPAALGVLAGSTLSAILMVVEGIKTWREAGSETAEIVLRGFGMKPREATKIARAELPSLAAADAPL